MAKVVKTVGIIALAGAAIITGVGLAAGLSLGAIGGLGVSLFGISTGLSVTQFGLLGALAVSAGSKPKLGDIAAQTGVKTPIANSTDTRKIIYGKVRVGGFENFIEEWDSNGGNDVPNDTLTLARVVADHPINSFVQFYLGDKAVAIDSDWDQSIANSGNATNAPYRDKLYLRVHDGTQITADGRLKQASASWTDQHVGNDQAYFTVKAGFDPDVYPFGVGDVRNCSMIIEGKKLYDPRLDSTYPGGSGTHRIGDPTTHTYSTNPALCIYDFLRDGMLGREWPDAEIDVASIVTAANICDEQVAVNGGGTIDRYTLNGVVDSIRSKLQNLNQMLTAMGGSYTYVSGKLAIFAAAPVVSTLSLDKTSLKSIRYDSIPEALINEVRGTYIEPADNYEAAEYPAVSDTGAQIEEGEEILPLNLPFTNDHRIAQRLAKIALNRARQPRISSESMPLGAALAPNNVASITWNTLGLSLEPFRLLKQSVSGGDGNPMSASLELEKEDAAVYSWAAATDEKAKSSALSLSQPTGLETFAPTNVTVIPAKIISTGGRETAVLNIAWDDPGTLVANTVVQYRANGDTTWIPGAISLRGDNNATLILPHDKGWDIRVRHIMQSGIPSPEVITSNISTDATKLVNVYRQSSTPSTTGGEGSIWIKTDTNEIFVLEAGVWRSGATNNNIFRQTTTPTGSYGDFWYDTDDFIWYWHDGTSFTRVGNDFTNTSQLTDGAGLGTTAVWSSVTGRSTIAMSINEGATGGVDNKRIRLFGLDGEFPSRTTQAELVKQDDSVFSFGGDTIFGNSTAYSGNGSNGVYYLVVDTTGTKRFDHAGTTDTHVGVCRNLGATTLEYFKATVGWLSLTHDSDMIVVGYCERRANAFVNATLFEPTAVADAPDIYSLVGIDDPSHLPAESIGGVYTLEPSAPATGFDNGATARIDIAASVLYYGDNSLSFSSGSVTSLSFSTAYHVYAIDDSLSGGSVTYQVTTDRTALPARHIYFGLCKTPADGAASTGGTLGGYAGRGGAFDPNYTEPTF